MSSEYSKEKDELELEHRSRLQTLHAQHHHAQFEQYEKNIKLQEQLQKIEEQLESKNKTLELIANR